MTLVMEREPLLDRKENQQLQLDLHHLLAGVHGNHPGGGE